MASMEVQRAGAEAGAGGVGAANGMMIDDQPLAALSSIGEAEAPWELTGFSRRGKQ